MATFPTADGARIFYRARGRGSPPFLFVHGWCSRLEHWQAQLRHFGRRHRVVALDRRGHGRSDPSPTGYGVERHASDLAALLRRERLIGAVVVAHAGGGPAALALARAEPTRVRAVVLLDSHVGPAARLDDPADAAGAAFAGMLGALAGPAGAEAFRTIYAGFFGPHAGPLARRVLADALATPLAIAAAELRGLAVDTEAIARAVAQPVLWISATGADPAALASVFARIDFGRVVGSGHFPQVEVPHQIHAMIERFVETLPGSRPAARRSRPERRKP